MGAEGCVRRYLKTSRYLLVGRRSTLQQYCRLEHRRDEPTTQTLSQVRSRDSSCTLLENLLRRFIRTGLCCKPFRMWPRVARLLEALSDGILQ